MKKSASMHSQLVPLAEPEAPGEAIDTVGLRVRHYREQKGLSQEELAMRVGAAQQTIQSLESGKIRKSTFLPLIAKELGVNFDALLFGCEQSRSSALPIVSCRRVPLFSTRDSEQVHAYLQDQSVQPPTGGWVGLDYAPPFGESGLRVFAIKLSLVDEAFQPEFRPGDQLVVDPDMPIQPGDPVVVFSPGAERLNLSKYRMLSHTGTAIEYELVSINPDFPSFSGNALKALEILGPVIQMRRPVASRVRLAALEEQFR